MGIWRFQEYLETAYREKNILGVLKDDYEHERSDIAELWDKGLRIAIEFYTADMGRSLTKNDMRIGQYKGDIYLNSTGDKWQGPVNNKQTRRSPPPNPPPSEEVNYNAQGRYNNNRGRGRGRSQG